MVSDLSMLRNKATQGKHAAFLGGLADKYIYLIIVGKPDVVIILSNHFFVLVALIGYLLQEKVI